MAAILALVGVVWILQGLGLVAGKSFMVGEPFWAIAGAAVIVLAAAYAVWPRYRSRGGR